MLFYTQIKREFTHASWKRGQVYFREERVSHSAGVPTVWLGIIDHVEDIGASLGRTGWLIPGTRDDLAGFEAEGFIRGVENNRVKFHYMGGWLEPQVVGSVAPGDVRWITGLLARLSPQQWADAFRAGGYTAAETERYVRRLREKVAEGQALQ